MVEVGGVPFCLAIINSKTSFQTFRNSEEELKNAEITCVGEPIPDDELSKN